MIEKVNPSHPDKVADRIAGALVDLAYKKEKNPKIAVEVLIGHSCCHIIAETSVHLINYEVAEIVHRIAGPYMYLIYDEHPQDAHLADNQAKEMHCGDNGIFKGVPLTDEQIEISTMARKIYHFYPFDGKYIIDGDKVIVCQSHASERNLIEICPEGAIINPLGYWTGGTDVDTGATNRKLGSDMFDGVTGGGINGKDLSKADVSVNIYCYMRAQLLGKVVTASCAIGDTDVSVYVDGDKEIVPFSTIVKMAREFIKKIGGFEKLAEWGLYQ